MNSKIFKLQTFLDSTRVSDDETYTHLSFGKNISGRFNINNINQFNKLYLDVVTDREYKNELSILEKNNEIAPLVFDIDLKLSDLSINERLYNTDLVNNLINIISHVILKMTDKKDKIKCYLYEKENNKIKDTYVKDGFHLILPNLILNSEERHLIRNKVVEKAIKEDIFNLYKYDESVDKIIDKAVMSSNNWFIYGSCKPDDQYSYKITTKYIISNDNIEYDDDNSTIEDNYYKCSFINCVNKYTKSNIKPKYLVKEDKPKEENNDYDDIKLTEDELRLILDNIDVKRYENYDDWLILAMIFINCDLDMSLFDEYSRLKSPKKYKPKENQKIIKGLKKNKDGFKIGTLIRWFKEDAKRMYNSFFKTRNENKIKENQKIQEELKKLKNEELNNIYTDMKIEFELTNFKVRNPVGFVEIKENDIIIRNKKNFEDLYQNKILMDGDKKISFIKKWLEDPNNRTYEEIDFLPMQQAPNNIYNTFKGYEAIKQQKNNLDIKESKIYNHLCNLCNNDDNVINYVIKFLARKVQQPYKLPGTALIFRSDQGCGKDTLFNWFGNNILGSKYYLNESKINNIFGNFNSSINNKILVVVNETDKKDTIDLKSIIKNEITREKNNIILKGKDGYDQTNNISYVFFSNQKNPLTVEADDRRFVGIQCNNKIANNREYFKALYDEIESKIYDKDFYDYFMNIDVSDYDFVNNRPITDFYKNLKEANISPIVKFLENELFIYHKKEEKIYSGNDLYNKYIEYIKQNNFKYEITSTKFGLDIKDYEGIIKKRSNKGIKYNINFITLKEYLIKNNLIEPFDNIEDNFIDSDEE